MDFDEVDVGLERGRRLLGESTALRVPDSGGEYKRQTAQ
jgi:hypothetical protein